MLLDFALALFCFQTWALNTPEEKKEFKGLNTLRKKNNLCHID